jgi:hypothetical protein
VTTSVGIAALEHDGEDVASLLRRADQALVPGQEQCRPQPRGSAKRPETPHRCLNFCQIPLIKGFFRLEINHNRGQN